MPPSSPAAVLEVLSPALSVVGVTIVFNIIVEALSWAWVYRTANWRRIVADLNRTADKLEAAQAEAAPAGGSAGSSGGGARAKKQGKEKRLEAELKARSNEMAAARMKLGLVLAGINILLFRNVISSYTGVMAKMPFTPWSFVTSMSHAGLEGDDMTECGAVFIFALATAFIKMNMSKLVGVQPSRAATRLLAPGRQMAAQHDKSQ